MLKIEELDIKGYERVIGVRDTASGLKAFIAVHSTVLGPSLGGIRMFPFTSQKRALEDSLRLSKAMSYKAAMAGLSLGGGKAVINADPAKAKSKALFQALGDAIEYLQGAYIAAEDSGISPQDLNVVSQRTKHVTGTSASKGGSDDPSPATARGVITGMQSAAKFIWKKPSLRDKTIAIQGTGQVGTYLAQLLHKEGAHLLLSDINEARARRLARRLNGEFVSPNLIHQMDCDIYAPCALGGALNSKTIPQIRACIIAGGANNQFAEEQRDSVALMHRGILHAPDYIINAGGLIQLYVQDILQKRSINPWIKQIGVNLDTIFQKSLRLKTPPIQIANALAKALVRMKTTRGK